MSPLLDSFATEETGGLNKSLSQSFLLEVALLQNGQVATASKFTKEVTKINSMCWFHSHAGSDEDVD